MMKNYEEATNMIGMIEGSSQFKKLINEYNKIRPLPSGYKMKYTDAWCAAFVSVCNQRAGITGLAECSVRRMYDLFKAAGRVTKKPHIGDVTFYKLNGIQFNHTGIIRSIEGNYLRIVEGNKSNAVGVRQIQKNSEYIIGFGNLSDFNKQVSTSGETKESIVKRVIRGDFGNGEERKKKLTEAGYDYKEVQETVNNYLLNNK